MRSPVATLAATLALAACGPSGPSATVYATGLANAAAFAMDARGGLWVATAAYTSGGQDGVWLVAGRGAAPRKVIGGLTTPLGLAWSGGWLYVASLGRVDAFRGFDGTAFAERRTVLDGPVAGGANNGLVVGADGRLLMGVSASCDHCVPASPWSAAIVSFEPDGSDLRVYAKGIRAPFGLALRPDSGDLFVTMNQRDDLGGHTPGDWLALVRDGDDWRFPDCYGQGGAACAGVPAPVGVLDQHAAAGGVAIVGKAAVVAEWAKGRLVRVELTRVGGTYRGTVSPYLTGLKNPLPVIVAPDGAVLVGDWGSGTVYRVARA